MSDQTSTAVDEHPAAAPENPFDRDDIAQFGADDQAAGRFLGKMLSYFFLYTVFAMSLAAYWTWRAVSH